MAATITMRFPENIDPLSVFGRPSFEARYAPSSCSTVEAPVRFCAGRSEMIVPTSSRPAPGRKALDVALVAVVAVVIAEGTGFGAASIHRHRDFIY